MDIVEEELDEEQAAAELERLEAVAAESEFTDSSEDTEAGEVADSETEEAIEVDSNLSDMKVDALKKMAKERGLKGFSKLNKSGLVALLEAEPDAEAGEAQEQEDES